MKTAVISLAVLIGILGGFYGGFRYGETKAAAATTTASAANANGGTQGQGGRGNLQGGNGGFAGGQAPCPSPGTAASAGRGVASGTITAVGNGTLTIHDARCNLDVKVSYGSSATVTKTTQGSAGDLATGETVTVIGQRQADGSVSATTISIQPARGQ